MNLDDKTIADLKDKVAPRELHRLEVENAGTEEAFTILVTPPDRALYSKFLDDLGTGDAAKKLFAHKNLVLASAVWPEREIVRDFCDRSYAALISMSNELASLVGADARVRSKKL